MYVMRPWPQFEHLRSTCMCGCALHIATTPRDMHMHTYSYAYVRVHATRQWPLFAHVNAGRQLLDVLEPRVIEYQSRVLLCFLALFTIENRLFQDVL